MEKPRAGAPSVQTAKTPRPPAATKRLVRPAGAATGEPSGSLRVGRALLDTTWRMAVPVIIGAGLGIILDLRFGSGPWLTIGGTVIGFVLAGKLVSRLLRETEEEL